MGEQAVNPRQQETREDRWTLASRHAATAQGLLVSGFKHLPQAEAIFLHAGTAGGGWLKELLPQITNAQKEESGSTAAAIAFTHSGLVQLKLHEDDLSSFSLPFQEGMHQTDRRRRLGDAGHDGAPTEAVVANRPVWSGNWQPDWGPTPRDLVHALLLLYGADRPSLEDRCRTVLQSLEAQGVRAVHRVSLWMGKPGANFEHFGFADGMSQPIPYSVEEDKAIMDRDRPGEAMLRHRWHGVPAGEILFGHLNAHGEPAPGPLVVQGRDKQKHLADDGAPPGFHNLGLNGSYLVVRELHQLVADFWNDMDVKAAALNKPGDNNKKDADWLATRIVGRTKDGKMLLGENRLRDGNDFGFFADDPHGRGCPMGSHVRRTNPRDSAAPDAGAAEGVLKSSNNHRILRRGRNFGPPLKDVRKEDGEPRGLLFMCLNTDIARQFEFIQQTWMMNQGFGGLDEFDPLVGVPGDFTIQGHPVRLKTKVKTYVKMAGGEYFFLPSIRALQYLSELKVVG